MTEIQQQTTSRRPLIILGIGDVLSLVLFATIGRQTHSEALTLQTVLYTAAPFVVAWFIVASVLGAYRTSLLSSPRVMFMQSLVVAVAAGGLGVFLRAGLLRVPVNPLFAVIALPMAALFVMTWRMLFIWVYRRNQATPASAAVETKKKPT